VNDIIKRLYDVGYTVVGLTTDQGGANVKTIKALVGTNEVFFMHPSNPHIKVHVFADAPHAIKLARSWYLDNGFIYNGKKIKKDLLEKILRMNSADLKVAFKLRQSDLMVSGQARQKVTPAVRLFCNTNGRAAGYLGSIGLLDDSDNWRETEEIFCLFNDWFDVFNSTMKQFNNKNPLKAPYGKIGYLEEQNLVLDRMISLMENLRVINKRDLMPWQKAIILSCRSLKAFLAYLKENYTTPHFKVQYILTSRLSQDVIENFLQQFEPWVRHTINLDL